MALAQKGHRWISEKQVIESVEERGKREYLQPLFNENLAKNDHWISLVMKWV